MGAGICLFQRLGNGILSTRTGINVTKTIEKWEWDFSLSNTGWDLKKTICYSLFVEFLLSRLASLIEFLCPPPPLAGRLFAILQNRVKSQHTVICHMADFSAVALSRTVKQKKKREETESVGEIKRFQRNPVCPLAPLFSFVCF